MDWQKNIFRIVVLPAADERCSHTIPGPLGDQVTSSVPTQSTLVIGGQMVVLQTLPRPNEREVDPATLLAARG